MKILNYDGLKRLVQQYIRPIREEINGLEIGGRNLLLQSATRRISAYSGAKISFETGVVVAEWGAKDAIRAYGTGGTNKTIATLGGVSVSTTSVSGENYVHSIFLKNNGAKSFSIANNGLGGAKTIQPGEIVRVVMQGVGNGYNSLQFTFTTPAAGDAFDFVYWHPQIETGTKVTDWTPAPEDAASDATAKANNALSSAKSYTDAEIAEMQIGARNILRDSGDMVSTTDYMIKQYSVSQSIAASTKYTVVVKANLPVNHKLDLYLGQSGMTSWRFDGTGKTKVYYAQFTTPSNAIAGQWVRFYNRDMASSGNGNADGSTGAIYWACLYEGNIKPPMDWVSAPEDMAPASHKQAYTASECTTYTSDTNTMGITPAAVKKAITEVFQPKSHTHDNMSGASTSAAGKSGFVPAPAAGAQAKYLRGDGTWQTPPNTTYSAATQSANGLMIAADKKKLDGMAIPKATTITIPISGWSSDSAAGYPKYYDIAVSGTTANDRASITIAQASLAAAKACGMCPSNETLAGKIRIRASHVPTAAITAQYWIEKGKE